MLVVVTVIQVGGMGGEIKCTVRPYSASHLSQRVVWDDARKRVVVVSVSLVVSSRSYQSFPLRLASL